MKGIKKKGKNHEDIQEMNRSLVIKLLRKMQICSRADIAKASGLNQSTITNIINEMIQYGLVKETGIINGEKGRRSIGLAIDSDVYRVIGIRLTRKSFSIGLFDLQGIQYDTNLIPLETSKGPNDAIQKIKNSIYEIIQDTDNEKIIGIGIAAPGPFIHNEARIALMTNFPGWEQINLREEIEKEFGLPLSIEHDANAGALAELLFGNPTRELELKSLVYVVAGQGIGAGILIDGSIYRGSIGTAGEIGHSSINYDGPQCKCGNKGCLELYCSSLKILETLQFDSMDRVWSELEKGNEQVKQEIEKAAYFLGIGLVNIVNTLNPDRIVIGDELSLAGPMLLENINKVMKRQLLPEVYESLSIELTSFSKDSILIGSAALVIEELFSNPMAYIN